MKVLHDYMSNILTIIIVEMEFNQNHYKLNLTWQHK